MKKIFDTDGINGHHVKRKEIEKNKRWHDGSKLKILLGMWTGINQNKTELIEKIEEGLHSTVYRKQLKMMMISFIILYGRCVILDAGSLDDKYVILNARWTTL